MQIGTGNSGKRVLRMRENYRDQVRRSEARVVSNVQGSRYVKEREGTTVHDNGNMQGFRKQHNDIEGKYLPQMFEKDFLPGKYLAPIYC